jgi:predicted flap endonuclease-1-like 5' DNA nuclease
LIGVIFADLFGSAGWDLNDAFAGTAFSILGQGIRDNLLNEFGEKMTPDESAVTLLLEHANWRHAVDSMREHNFQGVMVISQNVIGDLANVEKQLEDEKVIVFMPEKDEEIVASMPEALTIPIPKGLKYIEGIGDVYGVKLREAGIRNVEELLEKGATVQGRNEIAKTTGISEKLVLRWVNMADLYRIHGIGQEYAELLEAAGVDTVPELAQRVPANLLEAMVAANAQRKMVRRLPSLAQVEGWVAQAKSLPRVMTY